MLDQEEIIYAIYCSFAATKHGQELCKRIRYEKYNLESLTNDAWITLLGIDVNNLWHMLSTYSIARNFAAEMEAKRPGYLGDEEQLLLFVAAAIHDQGEAIVGDISYGDKSADHDLQEQLAFQNHGHKFSVGLAESTKQLIKRARDDVVFNQETKLGRLFNTVERIGYLRTALRAFACIQDGRANASEAGLRWLIADVLSNHPRELINRVSDYPPVADYLKSNEKALSDAFQIVLTDDFDNYGDNAESKSTAFEAARSAWETWLSSTG